MFFKRNIHFIGAFLVLIALAFIGMAVWNAHNIKTLSASYTAAELKQFRINYQITEDIIAELKLIHATTNTKPRPIKVIATALKSRHVWYKAQTIYFALQQIKTHRKLPETPLVEFLTQETTPADIFDILQSLLTETRVIRQSYAIQETPPPSSMPDHAFPTDVYRNLDIIAHMISGIDDQAVKPAHVYQVAVAIVVSLEKIRAAKGITTPVKIQQHKGKRPRDVYNAAFDLTRKLCQLAEMPDYKIADGCTLLDKHGGKLIPIDVIEVLANNLSDIQASRFAWDEHLMPVVESPLTLSGKTPTHVYNQVSKAVLLVETLR